MIVGLLSATSLLAQQPVKERTVSLTVTVTDEDLRFVGGLERDRFSLFENKTPLEIASFDVDDSPLSIAVLIDLSGSQSGQIIHITNWILRFIGRGNPANQYQVIGFNKGAGILCDWGCKEKDLLATMVAATNEKPKNSTALYYAVAMSLRQMERSSHARRIMVILSDGQDNSSKMTFTELRRTLKQSNVMVYAVGILPYSDGVMAMEGQNVLDELAAATGGKAFFPRSKDELNDIAEHVALELRHQYLFAFKVLGPPDREVHKIKVKVTPPVVKQGTKTVHLRVRYKEEFYDQ